jgi:hypothetical protein
MQGWFVSILLGYFVQFRLELCFDQEAREEAELCYAPQYGAAKDPVNICGMVAANAVRGDVELAHSTDLGRSRALVLDVRDSREFDGGAIEGSINIPLGQLRERLEKLPRDREIWISCGVGQRAYYA